MANSKLNDSTDVTKSIEKKDLLDTVHKSLRSQSMAHHAYMNDSFDSIVKHNSTTSANFYSR